MEDDVNELRAGEGLKRCLCLFIFIPSTEQTKIQGVLLTAAKQPGAALTSSIRHVVSFLPKCIEVHLICPATTNDILKSVLIFLPESRRNSQRPPLLFTNFTLMLSRSARTAVIGLNTPSPWPLNQYTESLSGRSVIITAKGNVHASVNVKKCVCLCLG